MEGRWKSMNDHGINEQLIPIGGGWRYEQEYGIDSEQKPFIYRIPEQGSAESFGHLVRLVTIFRVNQGMDIGEPDLDVANYIKIASRGNDIYKTGPIMRSRAITPLIYVMRTWLDAMQLKRPDTISSEDAGNRATICAQCPHNVEWKIKACGDCNDQVINKGACLRKVTTFPPADVLRACRVHGVYLPAAIFLDSDDLPDRSEQAPASCWMTTRDHERRPPG